MDGLGLEIPTTRRSDGLLGRALIPVPMDADSDASRVIEAAHRIHALLDDVTVLLDDDMGLVGTEGGLPQLNGGTNPATLLDDTDGDWEPALRPLPATLPQKLLDAVALLEGPPPAPSDKAGTKAWKQAEKAVSSSTHVGKLVLALEDDNVSRAARAAIRVTLQRVDPVVLGTTVLKRHKKLPHVACSLLEQVGAALDDVSPLTAVWLDLWRKGKSRYFWGDFHIHIPNSLLARMARAPEATDQLITDLAES
jgi:hypothetical protein